MPFRTLALALAAAAAGCGASPSVPDQPDSGALDAPPVDAAVDAPPGFGDLGGMCGVLNAPELSGTSPFIVRDTFTFARAFMDPADRPLLTPGGMHLIETPNAGGSSEMSELFAYEQLARCEDATLIKTETEVVYTNPMGKKTDLVVAMEGHKIGVSVTRAFAFPIGTTYTQQQATDLLVRKLNDIQLSSANVAPADAWEKQLLAYQAIDDQAADQVATVWATLDAAVRADTIVIITVTHGDDLFIYQN